MAGGTPAGGPAAAKPYGCGIGHRLVLRRRAPRGGLPRRGGARPPLGNREAGAVLHVHLRSGTGSPRGRAVRAAGGGGGARSGGGRNRRGGGGGGGGVGLTRGGGPAAPL